MLALAHLHLAVETDEKRHRQDALRFLAVLALQFAADEEVEALIGPAQFEVGFERDRVVALHERIEKLVHGDGELFGVALGEVFTFEKTRERVARGELNETHGAEGVGPFGVVADFGLLEVEHVAGLREVGFGVRRDLFAREGRTRDVASRRIADGGREVAHEEDHLMSEVLELTELVEHHRVPDVDVGRRGVEPELAAQGLARRLRAGELLLELFLDQEAVGAAADGGHGFADVVGHGKLLRDLNTFTHLCPFYSLRAPRVFGPARFNPLTLTRSPPTSSQTNELRVGAH